MTRVAQAILEELRKENSALADSEISRLRRVMSDSVTLTSGDSDKGADHHHG